MGTGYTRNDTPNNIADGNVINASDLDGEFDAIQSAFNASTGHSHDGTTGEGPQIATAGLADNAVTTVKITDANVTTAKIADANVTTAKIANANVTLAKMAANSVDSDQYVDGSIDRVHLAADIVDGTKIADDSIDSEHYVDGSIDTAHIANNAVTSAKLDTNIQVAGTLGVTGVSSFANGTNSAPSLTFTSDTNTGIYRGGTDILKFVTAGTDAVTINASQQTTFAGNIDVIGTATMDGMTVENTASNTVERTTTATNFAVNNTNFKATTSGDMLDGFGGALVFGLEDNASVDNPVAYLNWARDGADNSGELTFRTVSSGTSRDRLNLASNGDISFYEDTGTTPKLFWDASAERLGIGSSSPNYPLTVQSGTLNTDIAHFYGLNNSRGLEISTYQATNSDAGVLLNAKDSTYGQLAFGTTGTTRMTIDKDGNLLVGTTDTNPGNNSGGSDVGILLGADGKLVPTANNAEVCVFNRQSSDGDIVLLRKDGTTVGSIGTFASDLTIGDADVAIRFDTGTGLVPWNISTNVATNGAIDIGASSARFKDLYLSGGAYLGGTGSANYLDDYEEGSFDITITPETSGSITVTTGFNSLIYTKIGRIVHITGGVGLSGVSSPVGTFITIAGLPFTLPSLSENQEQVGFALYYRDDSTGTRSLLPCSYTSGTSFTATITAANIEANDAFQFDFSYVTS